jgi:hypothetical protein
VSLTAKWLDDFFAHYYRRRPVNATFIGVHDFDHLLPDYSDAGRATTAAEMRALLDRLDDGSVEREAADRYERIDLLLARTFLRQQLWETDSRHFQRGNPSLYTGEANFGVISQFLRDFAPFPERVRAATSRLQEISELLAQAREQITDAPVAWIERAVDECNGAEAFLTDGIDQLAPDGSDGDAMRGAAGLALASLREHRARLRNMPTNDDPRRYGVGRDAFDALLRDGHLLAEDASSIEAWARRRLDDEQAALIDGAQRIAGTDDWLAVLGGLADLHPSALGYLETFPRFWSAARETAIAHDLVTWPDFPIVFEQIPDWARTAAPHLYFLYYRSPAPYDAGLVQRYLVPPVDKEAPEEDQLRVLRNVNDAQIKLNHVVHHAGLGHHVQNWNAFRARSRVGQMAGVDCASRIAMFCAGTLVEGWACYATDLMEEAGFLTPLEALSMHHARLRMAARAIVDAGIHTHRMTLGEATAFYTREVGMSRTAAASEAVKNSMFPGAAMIYLSGTEMIHALRREISVIDGAAFSLRAFHDELLSYGSIPVSLIAREMRSIRAVQPA